MQPAGLVNWFKRVLSLGAVVGLLTACGTLSSLDSASQVLDTYELRPIEFSSPGAGRGPVLYVAPPTSSAAFQTERIVVKPGALQVTLLPDARWVETTPLHFQRVLRQTLVNSGQFRFVTAETNGPVSDFSVLADIVAFQVDVGGAVDQPPVVDLEVNMTLIRDFDQQVIASRRFESSTAIADVAAATVVSGFEAAAQALLRDSSAWIISTLAGRST